MKNTLIQAETKAYQNLRDVAKAVLGEQFITLNAYI